MANAFAADEHSACAARQPSIAWPSHISVHIRGHTGHLFSLVISASTYFGIELVLERARLHARFTIFGHLFRLSGRTKGA